jgi:murein DD-endopeptidase MepM/ murein hydrolase activator NlpD
VSSLLVALTLLAGVVTAGHPGVADAASTTTTPEQHQRDVDAELKRLKGEVANLDVQQRRAAAELAITRRDRTRLDAELAGFDGQLATVQTELDQVSAELDQAVARRLEAQRAVDAAKAKLREATELLNEQAVRAFIKFGSQPSVGDLLARIEDVNDAPRVVAWVDAVAERQGSVVAEQRRAQAGTAALEKAADEAQAAVASRRDEVAGRRAELEAVRNERAAAQAAVAQEQATEQRLLASLQSARAEAQAQVDELQRASATVAAFLQRSQAGQAVVRVRPGFLAEPVKGAAITSTFGWRVHPIFGDRRLHAGIDFAANTGTPVVAAADGTVLYASWMSGYGNTVIIDHGGSIATLYAHNSAIAVSVGAKVRRGQRLATSGATGNVTGPHVHFEVRVGGNPVDPLGYF